MFNYEKRLLKISIAKIIAVIGAKKAGFYFYEQITNFLRDRTRLITHQGISLRFAVPNRLNLYRVDSFSAKEPETLEWIEAFPPNSVVWDIGANIGLYSCYAAKARDCNVFAFEPSVFNLEFLARNIFLNDLTSRISIVPLPLTEAMGFSHLKMTTTEWGGALSTFGKNYGWDGREINQIFQYQTMGISLDEVFRLFHLPKPNYIKIDVDGIEHIILRGASNVLSEVDGVLIEVNDAFSEQAEECNRLLLESGLVFKNKKHSEIFDRTGAFGAGRVWNQIWTRS